MTSCHAANWCLLLLLSLAPTAAGRACPTYESVAAPSVLGSGFQLANMTGHWYVLASNEPTVPPFCTCNTLDFTVDGVDAQGRTWYHYVARPKCYPGGVTIPATMKGWGNETGNEPGFFHENMAIFNHSVATLVPNMVIDVLPANKTTGLPEMAATYACIGKVLGKDLFSLNLLSRSPAVSASAIHATVARLNATTRGALDLDNLKVVDQQAFAKCGIGPN